MTDLEWLSIGKIVAPQGLRGQVRVYPDTDFPERFLVPGERWLLRPGEKNPQPIELVSGYYLPGKKLYVVVLAGITNRTLAEGLRGAELFVPVGDRLPLGDDEYHVLDLIGLEVWEQVTQRKIGVVVDVLAAGNDLLEVELQGIFPQDTHGHERDPSPASPPSVELPLEPSVGESLLEGHGQTEAIQTSKSAKRARPKPDSKEPKRVLVPFVRAIVPIVDLHRGRVEITPPDGLID